MDGVNAVRLCETNSPYSVRLQLSRNELAKTWQERQEAIAEFGYLIDQVPSMIPEPADSLRTSQALTRVNAAIDAHARLVRRYLDLLTERSISRLSCQVR